jgi:hypothetical protein
MVEITEVGEIGIKAIGGLDFPSILTLTLNNQMSFSNMGSLIGLAMG